MRKHVALALTLLATLSCASLILIRPTAAPWEPPNKSATRAVTLSERPACLDRTPLRQAFFGDLHVHTRYSMDARSRDMLGSPDDALRFARGESIGLGPFDENSVGTRQAQLDRPLDFAAVTMPSGSVKSRSARHRGPIRTKPRRAKAIAARPS